jgi:hypothetical protein
MSDRAKKISELTAKTSLANSDVFVIVDAAASATKKITANAVASYVRIRPVVMVANSTTFIANSSHDTIFANCYSGNVNITLPASSVQDGKVYIFKITPANASNYMVLTSDVAGKIEDINNNYELGNTSNLQASYPRAITYIAYGGCFRIIFST